MFEETVSLTEDKISRSGVSSSRLVSTGGACKSSSNREHSLEVDSDLREVEKTSGPGCCSGTRTSEEKTSAPESGVGVIASGACKSTSSCASSLALRASCNSVSLAMSGQTDATLGVTCFLFRHGGGEVSLTIIRLGKAAGTGGTMSGTDWKFNPKL